MRALSKSLLDGVGADDDVADGVEIPLNALPRVSVKISDPETNETPRTMANALMNSRSLRPMRLFQLARSIVSRARG